MGVSFQLIVCAATVAWALVIFAIIFPVMLDRSAATHRGLLQLLTRETVAVMHNALIHHVDRAMHQALSGTRVIERLGSPYRTDSPPSRYREGWLDTYQGSNLPIPHFRRYHTFNGTETLVMQQYQSELAYLNMRTAPYYSSGNISVLPGEIMSNVIRDLSILGCRAPDASSVLSSWRWDSTWWGRNQLFEPVNGSASSFRGFEFPRNIWGMNYNVRNLTRWSRNRTVALLQNSTFTVSTDMMPGGENWYASGNNSIDADTLRHTYKEPDVVILAGNFTTMLSVNMVRFPAGADNSVLSPHPGPRILCTGTIIGPKLDKTVVDIISSMIGFERDIKQLERQAAASAIVARTENDTELSDAAAMTVAPQAFLLDGKGFVLSSSTAPWVHYETTLPFGTDPRELRPECIRTPSRDVIGCRKLLSEHADYELLRQIQVQLGINFTDIGAAMSRAKKARANIEAGGHVSDGIFTASVLDPRNGATYELSWMPLIANSSQVTDHHSIVVLVPQSFLIGPIVAARNTAIVVSVVLLVIALAVALLALHVVGAEVDELTARMEDPWRVDIRFKKLGSAALFRNSSSSSLSSRNNSTSSSSNNSDSINNNNNSFTSLGGSSSGSSTVSGSFDSSFGSTSPLRTHGNNSRSASTTRMGGRRSSSASSESSIPEDGFIGIVAAPVAINGSSDDNNNNNNDQEAGDPGPLVMSTANDSNNNSPGGGNSDEEDSLFSSSASDGSNASSFVRRMLSKMACCAMRFAELEDVAEQFFEMRTKIDELRGFLNVDALRHYDALRKKERTAIRAAAAVAAAGAVVVAKTNSAASGGGGGGATPTSPAAAACKGVIRKNNNSKSIYCNNARSLDDEDEDSQSPVSPRKVKFSSIAMVEEEHEVVESPILIQGDSHVSVGELVRNQQQQPQMTTTFVRRQKDISSSASDSDSRGDGGNENDGDGASNKNSPGRSQYQQQQRSKAEMTALKQYGLRVMCAVWIDFPVVAKMSAAINAGRYIVRAQALTAAQAALKKQQQLQQQHAQQPQQQQQNDKHFYPSSTESTPGSSNSILNSNSSDNGGGASSELKRDPQQQQQQQQQKLHETIALEDLIKITASVASTCSRICTRLPVSCIEFLGDSLVVCFTVRSLWKRSRILVAVLVAVMEDTLRLQQLELGCVFPGILDVMKKAKRARAGSSTGASPVTAATESDFPVVVVSKPIELGCSASADTSDRPFDPEAAASLQSVLAKAMESGATASSGDETDDTDDNNNNNSTPHKTSSGKNITANNNNNSKATVAATAVAPAAATPTGREYENKDLSLLASSYERPGNGIGACSILVTAGVFVGAARALVNESLQSSGADSGKLSGSLSSTTDGDSDFLCANNNNNNSHNLSDSLAQSRPHSVVGAIVENARRISRMMAANEGRGTVSDANFDSVVDTGAQVGARLLRLAFIGGPRFDSEREEELKAAAANVPPPPPPINSSNACNNLRKNIHATNNNKSINNNNNNNNNNIDDLEQEHEAQHVAMNSNNNATNKGVLDSSRLSGSIGHSIGIPRSLVQLVGRRSPVMAVKPFRRDLQQRSRAVLCPPLLHPNERAHEEERAAAAAAAECNSGQQQMPTQQQRRNNILLTISRVVPTPAAVIDSAKNATKKD